MQKYKSFERSCGAVVYRDGGKTEYLLVRQKGGLWGFPKGHVEGSETERETARREIKEETGLDVSLADGFRASEEYALGQEGRPDVFKQVIYFIACCNGMTPKPQDREIAEARLFDFDSAMKALRFESQREILKKAEAFLNACAAMKKKPMKLIPPSMEYDRQIQEFRRDFLEFGGSMDGCGSLRRFDNTQDWIDQVEALKRPETTPEGLVPMTQYIYVRETDNKIVGVIQIRHYFNEFLEKYAGHIGYSVCPSERRKGYATEMLRRVLPECRALGIKNVLVSCVKGNEGSRRTILNNGGVYESTVYLKERDEYLERYWIDLE
jgi:predicted acetyltransferase/ADP-ribose pyrophosphatase YjhB (NUDIX family)